MTVLPVRLEQWQLQCCGVDYLARVGKPWAAPLIFYPDEWSEAEVATPGWSVLPNHRISVRGHIKHLKANAGERSLLDIGDCSVGVLHRIDAPGVVAEGIVLAEWHGAWSYADKEDAQHDIAVEGIVRRIRGFEEIRLPDPEDRRYIPIKTRRLRLIELLRTDRARSDVLLDLDVSREAG